MLKNFRKPHPRPKKSTLITGLRSVINALREGKALDRIFLQNTAHGKEIDELRLLARENAVPINKVPIEKIDNFHVTNHEGCVAVISKIRYLELQQVISFVVDKGEVPLFLLLDGVTDIRNIGAIARSAYCFGVHAIVIPEKGVGALNEDAILTSAGALEHIAVCRVNSLMKAVDELHLNGIRVFAAEMEASKEISACPLHEPSAIIVGAEEKGIFPGLSRICDEQFKIPMSGDFDSLNVSVATGIALYEVHRQRLAATA